MRVPGESVGESPCRDAISLARALALVSRTAGGRGQGAEEARGRQYRQAKTSSLCVQLGAGGRGQERVPVACPSYWARAARNDHRLPMGCMYTMLPTRWTAMQLNFRPHPHKAENQRLLWLCCCNFKASSASAAGQVGAAWDKSPTRYGPHRHDMVHADGTWDGDAARGGRRRPGDAGPIG